MSLSAEVVTLEKPFSIVISNFAADPHPRFI